MKKYQDDYNNSLPGQLVEYYQTYSANLNALPNEQKRWAADLYDQGLADLVQKRVDNGLRIYYIIKRKNQTYIPKYDRLGVIFKEKSK